MDGRPGSPDNFPVRVTRRVRRHDTELFWEGSHDEYKKKLDEGFPEMFDDVTYYVERLEIDGQWRRMMHPLDWHEKYKHAS